MTAKLFVHNLKKFNISLEEDATAYISSILNDLSLDETEEIKESTESFLIDAQVSQDIRSDFYKNLFVNKVPKESKELKTITERKPILPITEEKVYIHVQGFQFIFF